MQYVLLIYSGDAVDRFEQLPEAEQRQVMGEYLELSQHPAMRGGAQLERPDTATTVRVDGAETLTTDGPFAEAKEALGGFYPLEADSLDDALEVAARIPAARMGGAVEVRPIVER